MDVSRLRSLNTSVRSVTPVKAFIKKSGPAKRTALDALVVITGVLLAYIGSLQFNLSEQIQGWLATYEYVQLDELPLTVLVFALLSLWFSHRRMQESLKEIQRRKLAEAQLLSSQHLYITLFEGDLTGNVVIDMQGNIGMHNKAFQRICRPIDHCVSRLFEFDWSGFVLLLQTQKEINFNKLQVQRPDGLPCYVSARFIYIDDKLSVPQIHAYLVDMTEQCLVELDLERTLNDNRTLARHAMQVQEQERKYIASEIHDETGQFLTAIRMDALALQKCTLEQMQVIAVRIASNTSHVQQSVRALIKHLRPPTLDALGLLGATQQLVGEWRKLHPQVQCQLRMALNETPLDENVNIVAYRVIQEALTNISRHAFASEVQIELRTEHEQGKRCLLLEIHDNGRGMDMHLPADGIGLIGMRERIDSLQGIFKLHSAPDQGTHIYCLIPLITNTAQTPDETTSGDFLHASN